jgi:endonuclease YncB( thermonuclease family)
LQPTFRTVSSAILAVALLCVVLSLRAQERPGHAPRPGDEGVFYGPLVRVKDGDSFEAKIQGVVMEFRLSDVDAPEYDQPYGREARDELRSLIDGRELVLVFVDTDRYGRTVTQAWMNDLNVNHEMVRRGAAWFYPQFARDETVFAIENEARSAKRGLWALSSTDRVEPWVWRERKRSHPDRDNHKERKGHKAAGKNEK